MATIEYWIQIENHAWDVAPTPGPTNDGIDRMTGQTIQQVTGNNKVVKTLTSPVTNVTRTRMMFLPLGEDALILRRYTANWAAPDDRKVNPWDLNEPDPTDNGTMGTIPGVVIECNVGDTVVVHFRNRDTRAGKVIHERAHSLHPHGFVFDNRYDGAYPLSPPDPTQPVGAQAVLWALLGVTGNKKGDRVPPRILVTLPTPMGVPSPIRGTPLAGQPPPVSGITTITPSAIPTTSAWGPLGSLLFTTLRIQMIFMTLKILRISNRTCQAARPMAPRSRSAASPSHFRCQPCRMT